MGRQTRLVAGAVGVFVIAAISVRCWGGCFVEDAGSLGSNANQAVNDESDVSGIRPDGAFRSNGVSGIRLYADITTTVAMSNIVARVTVEEVYTTTRFTIDGDLINDPLLRDGFVSTVVRLSVDNLYKSTEPNAEGFVLRNVGDTTIGEVRFSADEEPEFFEVGEEGIVFLSDFRIARSPESIALILATELYQLLQGFADDASIGGDEHAAIWSPALGVAHYADGRAISYAMKLDMSISSLESLVSELMSP